MLTPCEGAQRAKARAESGGVGVWWWVIPKNSHMVSPNGLPILQVRPEPPPPCRIPHSRQLACVAHLPRAHRIPHFVQARPGWVYLRHQDDGAGGPHWSRPTRQHYIVLSPRGMLEYYESDPIGGRSPAGILSLVRAQITPLGTTTTTTAAALQVKLAEGHVVHIETTDDAERDRWCFELNLAGLRAASSDLHTMASTPSSRGPSPLRSSLPVSPTSSRPVVTGARPQLPVAPPPTVHTAARTPPVLDGRAAQRDAQEAQHKHAPDHEQQSKERAGHDEQRQGPRHDMMVGSEPARRPESHDLKPSLSWADDGEAAKPHLPPPARLPPPAHGLTDGGRPPPGTPSRLQSSAALPPLSARSPSRVGSFESGLRGQQASLSLPSGVSMALRSPISTVKRTNWGAIASFIDGASVFAVSRMWSDLIAAFAFNLHSVPFCGGFLETPCTADAAASAQFVYAMGCVPIAALVKHLSETRFRHVPGASMVPPMMGYFVGWAVANAFLQQLLEIADANPTYCSAELGCTALNALYSLGITVASALIIVFLQPFSQDVDCGEGECVDWLEDWLEDIWQLVIRGASATSMVLWYHTAAQFTTAGTAGASEFAKTNLLSCFTLVTFFVGSLISHRLEQGEDYLRSIQRAHPAAWRGALIRYSDVLQNLLGFVAGCLTTDIITKLFLSLNEGPTPSVFLANLGITVAWTFAAGFYLSRTGEIAIDASADRDKVEAFFIVNSMGFFVGWMWLVVARDLVTMVGFALRLVLSPFGVTSAQDQVTQLAAVLLACPFLTLAVGWLQVSLAALAGETGPTARAEKEKRDMAEERRQRHAEVAASKAYLSSSASQRYSSRSSRWQGGAQMGRVAPRPASQLH